ncbi:MAG TPA: hypothetical protein VFX98_09525 [Longimicrobiaceae bacterium]|nr:hypothetical protein [Longimicrobiaceae bacterium]
MRTSVFAAAAGLLALAACGPATTGTTPQRSTTTISLPASGSQGVGATGTALGTGTTSITSYNEVGPVLTRLQASPDEVWRILPVVYQVARIPLGTLDTSERLLGNRKLTVTRQLNGEPLSRIVNCGTSGMGSNVADTYRVVLYVESRVRAVEGGASLETTVQGQATQPAVSSPPVQCYSTGQLERMIAREVQNRLLNPATPG